MNRQEYLVLLFLNFKNKCNLFFARLGLCTIVISLFELTFHNLMLIFGFMLIVKI